VLIELPCGPKKKKKGVGRKYCLFKQLLVLGHYFANVLQFGHFSKNVPPINV
jgi:hypothetical protein